MRYLVTWKHHALARQYDIRRSTTVDGPWTALGITSDCFFIDEVAEGTYYYQVRARFLTRWTDWSVVSDVLALGASYRPEDSYTRTGAQFAAASSQYFLATNNVSLDLGSNTAFWFSFWVNSPVSALSYRSIVAINGALDIRLTTTSIQHTNMLSGGFPTITFTNNQWEHFLCYSTGNGTWGIIKNGNAAVTQTYNNTAIIGQNLSIGARFAPTLGTPFDGSLDNILFGKSPTESFANIAAALFNSNNGLAFQDITAQQESDWGIVSGWLGNSLTQDYFGTNHLTNNNGVTQTIGKVDAAAVENDPVYILEDSSGNSKNVSQTTLASRPVWKDAIINGYPVLVFDGADDFLAVSNIGSLSFPLALYAVFKVDTLGRRNIITIGTGIDRLDLLVEQGNVVSARVLTITPFAIPQSTLPFTDVENWHRLCGVFESNNKRTVYLDDTTGTPETTAMTNSLTGYGLYLGNTIGNDFDFDGQIAFACLIPNWTLEKQRAVDRYSLLTFFTVPDFEVNPFTLDSLSISWSAFASGTVLEYELQKATAVNGPWTTILRTTATTHTDTGLTEGSTYYYRVRAVVSNGVTGWSTGSATVVEFEPIFLNPQLLLLPENSYSRTGAQFVAPSGQYLSVASNSSVQSGGRFWFSFWVYFDVDPFTQHIICKGNIGGNNVFEYAMFVLSGVFRLSIGNGVAITGLNHTFNPAATTWYHCFGFGEAGGTMGMLIDGANLITASAPATFLDGTGSLGLGYHVDGGIGYHNGRIDNVLFGKPPTPLGDGTVGSLAHAIATALFNSNNGLAFQDITAQQQSDWGIVSGWLDNSLTADAFGSNTLTNNNGVTQAAGAVQALSEANDPVYFIEDASNSNNDITQTSLASSPLFLENVLNGKPALRFDGATSFLSKTFTLTAPYSLLMVATNPNTAQNSANKFLASSPVQIPWMYADGRALAGATATAAYTQGVADIRVLTFPGGGSPGTLYKNGTSIGSIGTSAGSTALFFGRRESATEFGQYDLHYFAAVPTVDQVALDSLLSHVLKEFFQVLDVATTNIGTTTVSLEWAAFTTITPTEYEVQRATAAEGPWTEIGTSVTADYDDTGLTEGTTYYYRVRANTAKGYSAWSTAISARPGIYVNAILGSDNDYVTSESAEVLFDDLRLEAINSSATTIVLTYALSELTATGYEVQRSLAVDGPWTTISTAAGPYVDSGRIEGTTYYYRARANTASGWTSWSAVSRKAGLLLDSVSGAIIAYSLRQLRVDYSGPAIRVRRSSDNSEQDIGFVNGVLDTATLLTFVGAGSGFVTTWYDQSANGFHASQSIGANQPLIVFLGSLFTVNSLAAVDFMAGASQSLSTSVNIGLVGDPPHSVALVHQVDSVTTVVFATGSASTNTAFSYWIGYAGLYNWGYGNFQGLDVPVPDINTQYLELYFKSPGLHTVTSLAYRNGLNAGTTSDATAPAITNNRFWLGGWIGGANYMYDGKIQELILFNEDHRDIRSTIESNINNHYNVY